MIEGTLFHHRDIHKTTWTSPNGFIKSQTHYVLINGKWRTSLQDVRVYKGTDVACDQKSTEWNAPLYVNFIDFEKAFDGIHRDSLWKIL